MVLRDLFDSAGDLDIAITEKGLTQLNKNFELKQKDNGWYTINDNIEGCLDVKDDYKIEKVGKYNLESLPKYYDYLKNSTREKDIVKYEIVKNELDNRKQEDLK